MSARTVSAQAIALLGLRFNLPKGGAAKIGASTGLGAEKNVQLAKQARVRQALIVGMQIATLACQCDAAPRQS